MDDAPEATEFEMDADAGKLPVTFTQLIEASPMNWRMFVRPPAWRPPTDVFETEEAFVVRVEIAGMQEGDFLVELNGRFLSIRGVRQDLSGASSQAGRALPQRIAYHQMEIHFGEFSIEFELPQPVEADQVQAGYQEGFLRVTLPKARPRHISINR